jgi:hypothetical protein
MATTDTKTTTTTWLPLRAACELMPEPVLKRRLRDGKTRSRGLTENGTVVEIPPEFWGRGPTIDQARSSARSRFLSPVEWFHQIEVLCDTAVTDSVRWALVTARRLKAEGKLREGMSKADAARLIEAEMAKAVRAGQVHRALKWRSIANQMLAWGIWPISAIK